MIRRPPSLVRHSILVAVAACSSVSEPPLIADRCPEPAGEFGPSGCGVVRGIAVDHRQIALQRIGLRVDSVGPHGYQFSSNSVSTGEDRAFELLVHWLDLARPLSKPDTATIVIKAYFADGDPMPRQREDARANVLVQFATLGSPVHAVEGTFVFTSLGTTQR
jgi:hypothetical protein